MLRGKMCVAMLATLLSAVHARTTVRAQQSANIGRRGCVGVAAAALLVPQAATAFIAGKDEEVSGLVVLRVAEVCQFQEKLLRQLAQCSAQQKSKTERPSAADQFGNACKQSNGQPVKLV